MCVCVSVSLFYLKLNSFFFNRQCLLWIRCQKKILCVRLIIKSNKLRQLVIWKEIGWKTGWIYYERLWVYKPEGWRLEQRKEMECRYRTTSKDVISWLTKKQIIFDVVVNNNANTCDSICMVLLSFKLGIIYYEYELCISVFLNV